MPVTQTPAPTPAQVAPVVQPQAPQQMQPPQQLGQQQQFMHSFMMPQQSVQQMGMGGGNAQQTQNFMNALNQTGAGGNNRFMNAPGQQGQGPQAGFMGFQQNGMGMQGPQAMQGGGYGGGGMSFAGNGASQNQMGYQLNGAQQGYTGQQAGPQAGYQANASITNPNR